ncbi:MAG: cupin domain-containing protein [Trueperaceae bacterium]|nr:cupin domain-containing protein [Trueperaceae bacterium]
MISQETAEHYVWGDGCDGWHLLKTAELSIIQERVPAGKAEVRHYHRQARQFFFVLRGEATLELEGALYTLLPQQGLEVAPGQAHQLQNNGEEDLLFLVTSCPPSHGDRVQSLDPQS